MRWIVKLSNNSFAGVPLAGWFLGLAIVAAGALAWQEMRPFGIEMPSLDGQASVDPRTPLTVRSIGLGTRLASVELRDDSGQVVARAAAASRFTHEARLAFGTRYILKATAERPWLGQRETKEVAFTTVVIPKLDSPLRQDLAPDASITLHFDRPVGTLTAADGNLKLEVRPDETRQTFRLVASDYAQGHTYPMELNWETSTGVPLPPLKLEITTAPPLFAEINNHGKANLGLALPLNINFSEPLVDREKAGRHITVRTRQGAEVAGKWQWINKHRLQFVPQPGWPALSTVDVSIDRTGLRSQQGGFLSQPVTASFSTGPDKRIVVYLDTQKASAIENGQVVRTLNVSTGKPATPTVTGSFYIYARFPLKTMRSRAKPGEKGHYVVEDVPYAQYFYEDYALHGAWWHNGFGHPASHGCVNLSTQKKNRRWPGAPEDAGWLYEWASLGVPVTVQKHAPTQMAMQ
jgi:lipoprotein-anchoring transpeptidase ErfK/SrfK